MGTLVMRLAALKTAYGSSRMKFVWSSTADTVSGFPGPALKGANGIAAKLVFRTSKLRADGVPKLCAGGAGMALASPASTSGFGPIACGAQGTPPQRAPELATPW